MKIFKSLVQFIKISKNESSQRIDNFLKKKLKNISKNNIYKILRKGEVRVNKKRVKPKYKIKTQDLIRIPPLKYFHVVKQQLTCESYVHFNVQASILYEDKYLLILNKPSGIAVHKGSGISSGIIEKLRNVYPKNSFLELVHRLDRGTSGILLIAKKRSILCNLHKQLREGKIYKDYLILVHGRCNFKNKTVSAPLKKKLYLNKNLNFRKQKVLIDKNGKLAKTKFNVIEKFQNMTLLKVITETGRMHQIRVHAQHIHHPIVCDDLYGNLKKKETILINKEINRIFLHAFNIRFQHPNTLKNLHITAPLDKILIKYLKKLRNSANLKNLA
ncbi:Ribosomal large subunit pseudouridine synthase C [Wigglesworthia glossinidia endosymbiont of Glossina morsitans morsitans (Yale colony)]|uniref:Pseudouridine synthase n=1 Tax=Wigglesworthia glossinidia endosymbiont of Glossina morsitans morsitans (Yale colony) TaxID=1142511 RepID=H6Q5P8_WIGGL|nr:RluA family pseudouridine synthase [Wigglesworthia glossinidia]AFA40953.1 Ribosomal large subunit pseudouridine synthase C [Wigglesworthia glossinidia endosymbiont of Glossina morsitans morsitans (Yale colony)]